MLFINATLSKNQLYKQKNQINKIVPIISKQDDIELFSKYICVILLMSKIMLQFTFVLS